jgi:hypothetical protein
LATIGVTSVWSAQTSGTQTGSGMKHHYYIPATEQTVHWGYFSRSLQPVVEVESGDFVTIETLTHHAYDDFERMIKTQVVDGNWGIHAIIKKQLFAGEV